MTKQIISTQQAPAAIGTYSQATRHGDVVTFQARSRWILAAWK